MLFEIIVGGCVVSIGGLGYMVWSMNKTLDVCLQHINTIHNELSTYNREFRMTDSKIYDCGSVLRKEVFKTFDFMNKDIQDLNLRVNELNQQMNGMQGNLNLLKPIITYIRAKEAASKSSNVHRNNMDRVVSCKKEANDLLK